MATLPNSLPGRERRVLGSPPARVLALGFVLLVMAARRGNIVPPIWKRRA